MDYYQLLDVPRVASAEDIENRYHELAKKYHPDRSRSPDAHEKFIKIKEAYETLKNPQKRKAYDAVLPPEEKTEEVSSGPIFSDAGYSEGSSPDSEVLCLNSSTPPVSNMQLPGSNRAFKSPNISYVPFKSSLDSHSPVQSASIQSTSIQSTSTLSTPPSEVFHGSQDTDKLKLISSEESSPHAFQSKTVLPDQNKNIGDWAYVKVKYAGTEENIDDNLSKKSSGFLNVFVLRKVFRYTLALIFVLVFLMVVSPDIVGAKVPGSETVIESFNRVILLAKSLV